MSLKLYKEQKNTIYKIQKELGLSKDYLYKYARGEIKISKMPGSLLLKIARCEHIDYKKLYYAMIEYQERSNFNVSNRRISK